MLTLTNDGNASITLHAITVSLPGFAASGCAAGTVLGPGQACDLSLTFTPTVATDYAATLSVPIAGEAQPYRVALSGSGSATAGPAPSLGPTSATRTCATCSSSRRAPGWPTT